MKFLEGLQYSILSYLTYLAVCAIEVFVLRHVLDMISDDFAIRLVASVLCLFVVNPLLTYQLMEKLPFAPKGLRVAAGLEEALKSEVELPDRESEE